MAGKRQHHIWQFIQRGFGEKRGKDHHIWVYEKGRHPRQTATRKYGVEPLFFSEGDDNAADNSITSFENSIQSHLQDLRTADHETDISPKFMAPFVTHLEMRSLFLREEMSSLGEKMLARLQDIFDDERKAENLMLSYLQSHPELIDEKLKDLGIQREMIPIIKAIIDLQIPSLVKQQAAPIAEMARSFLTPLIREMPRISKGAHLRSLGEGFSDIERTNLHLKMNYRFCKSTDDILLSDTGLVFFKQKGLAPFSQKGDDITDLIIPLGSKSYIYGFRKDPNLRSVKTINSALASCSYLSFVASNDTPSFRKLSNRIGKYAMLISDHDIGKIISFENLLKDL